MSNHLAPTTVLTPTLPNPSTSFLSYAILHQSLLLIGFVIARLLPLSFAASSHAAYSSTYSTSDDDDDYSTEGYGDDPEDGEKQQKLGKRQKKKLEDLAAKFNRLNMDAYARQGGLPPTWAGLPEEDEE